MIDFDYYQIKGKWNAATLNRRAEKLEEAQSAADELEEAGAKCIEIIGVKAGKRETIRGKKKAPKAAKTPKAKKVPAKKKKAAKGKKKPIDKISKMSADDLRAIDSIFSHDGKIKILKTNTPKREPAGQLDLFTGLPVEITGKRFKNYKIKFTNDELFEIVDSYDHFTGKRNKNLEETIKQAEKLNKDVALDLSENEIKNIIDSLKNYYVKYYFEDTIKLQKQLEKILQ